MSDQALSSQRWILEVGPTPLSTASDEFISEHFRVRLHGPCLSLEAETHIHDPVAAADSFVEQYVSTLGRGLCHFFRPKREGEPWPFLPWARTVSRRSPPDSVRLQRALQEARESLVINDPTLRNCYRYWAAASREFAAHRFAECLVHAYKLKEAVEKQLEGQSRAKRRLGLAGELQLIGRLSNESRRDVRHPPKQGESVRPVSAGECASAVEAAKTVLRALETHVRQTS